jgi:DNA-binding response OmpR family regulator
VPIGAPRLPVRRYLLQKGYIVVIEPDELIRHLLESWLKDAGYTVVIGGYDGRAHAEPQLVIANIPSPSRGGPVVACLERLYSAPILAVSARFRRGLGDSVQAARALGVRRVLPKPFNRKELMRAVRASLESPA